MTKTIYVVFAEYGDKSGHCLIHAYDQSEEADRAVKMIELAQPGMVLAVEVVEYDFANSGGAR